jgi:hypothetical protein
MLLVSIFSLKAITTESLMATLVAPFAGWIVTTTGLVVSAVLNPNG